MWSNVCTNVCHPFADRKWGSYEGLNVATMLPVDVVKALAPTYEVEAAPPVFGASRVYIENVGQIWALQELVLRSLQALESGRPDGALS